MLPRCSALHTPPVNLCTQAARACHPGPLGPRGIFWGCGALGLYRFSIRSPGESFSGTARLAPLSTLLGLRSTRLFSCYSPSGCCRWDHRARTADKKTWRSASFHCLRSISSALTAWRVAPLLPVQQAAWGGCAAGQPQLLVQEGCDVATRTLASRRRLLGTRTGRPVVWHPAGSPAGQDGSLSITFVLANFAKRNTCVLPDKRGRAREF